MSDSLQIIVKAAGLDVPQRMIYGYAVVCKVDGEPYGDTQGDCITEEDMIAAALDFAKNSCAINDMHAGPDVGRAYFVFPMSSAIAKSLGMTWTAEAVSNLQGPGMLIGAQLSEAEFALVQKGERAGFSIEGVGERTPWKGA
jgi:hypothetical protein